MQTIKMKNNVYLLSSYSMVGPMEGKGPLKEYFDYVLEHSPEKDKSKILVIGDSMSSDILGGINFGVDTCWFNPAKSEAKYKFNYEIKKLSELKSIL